MYDQHSTDVSQELARSLGIEVREFGDDTINDQAYLDIKNHCWKECRGKGIDYVIVCDVDEFVTIKNYECIGGSERFDPFPSVKGFNMISETLPLKDIFEINTGSESESYSKQAIFNPDVVQEINYVHGAHKNNVVKNLVNGYWHKNNVRLYHYRCIGGVQRLIDRHAVYRDRLSKFNKKYNMGFHYLHSDEAKRQEWEYMKSHAKELW